jgi:hypothetical protein
MWSDESTLFDGFDHSSWGLDFDHSCLEAIDDQLLVSPTGAWADICWAEAVKEDLSRSVFRHHEEVVRLEVPAAVMRSCCRDVSPDGETKPSQSALDVRQHVRFMQLTEA